MFSFNTSMTSQHSILSPSSSSTPPDIYAYLSSRQMLKRTDMNSRFNRHQRLKRRLISEINSEAGMDI
eukprot:6213939-Pleurochrysis_carterae.AAC.4